MAEALLAGVGLVLVAVGAFLLVRSSLDKSDTQPARLKVPVLNFEISVPISLGVCLLGVVMLVMPWLVPLLDGSDKSDQELDDLASCTEDAAATSSSSDPSSPGSVTGTTTAWGPLVSILGNDVGDGRAFVFKNNGGVICEDYVEDATCHRATRAIGLRLRWDMSGGGGSNGGWGVQWESAAAAGFDASSFDSLVVWVRGTEGGEEFQVGLKDLSGEETKVESKDTVIVSSSEWRALSIDLSELTGVDTAHLENVNLGFNSDHDAGQICVDQIDFR